MNKIKTLAAIKVLVLIALASSYGLLEWGEKPVQAQGQGATGAPKGAGGSPAAGDKPKYFTEEPRQNTLLDDLLDLPKIDTAGSQKDELGRYIDIVERAKKQVEGRREALEKRYGQLKKLEKVVEEKLAKLEKERQFFLKTVSQEKKLQKERVAMLSEIYQKMEPKKAAPIFAQMDKDLAVAILQELKVKQRMNIMQAMETTDQAVDLTQYIGRVGSAREYALLQEVNRSLGDAFQACKS